MVKKKRLSNKEETYPCGQYKEPVDLWKVAFFIIAVIVIAEITIIAVRDGKRFVYQDINIDKSITNSFTNKGYGFIICDLENRQCMAFNKTYSRVG